MSADGKRTSSLDEPAAKKLHVEKPALEPSPAEDKKSEGELLSLPPDASLKSGVTKQLSEPEKKEEKKEAEKDEVESKDNGKAEAKDTANKDVKEDKEEKNGKPETARPVFGAASTFGSASVFEKLAKPAAGLEEPEAPKAATSSFGSFGGSFGSKSKFGNALQKATQKKSFLDEPSQEETTPENSQTQQYQQVDLAETQVRTGEENEQSVFSTTAKLFELDLSNITQGWKERGLGPLHLNKSLDTPPQVRLVMRSHGLLRVVLNYKILASTVLLKGLDASLSPGKFLRMNSVLGGKPVQYMLKFSNQGIRDELYDEVEALKKELAKD